MSAASERKSNALVSHLSGPGGRLLNRDRASNKFRPVHHVRTVPRPAGAAHPTGRQASRPGRDTRTYTPAARTVRVRGSHRFACRCRPPNPPHTAWQLAPNLPEDTLRRRRKFICNSASARPAATPIDRSNDLAPLFTLFSCKIQNSKSITSKKNLTCMKY